MLVVALPLLTGICSKATSAQPHDHLPVSNGGVNAKFSAGDGAAPTEVTAAERQEVRPSIPSGIRKLGLRPAAAVLTPDEIANIVTNLTSIYRSYAAQLKEAQEQLARNPSDKQAARLALTTKSALIARRMQLDSIDTELCQVDTKVSVPLDDLVRAAKGHMVIQVSRRHTPISGQVYFFLPLDGELLAAQTELEEFSRHLLR